MLNNSRNYFLIILIVVAGHMASANFLSDFFTSVGNSVTAFFKSFEPATPASYDSPPPLADDPNTYTEPAKLAEVPAARDCIVPVPETHKCDIFDDTKARFINVCVDQENPESVTSPMNGTSDTAN